MEHKIYSKQVLKQRSFFQKILGLKDKANVIVKINNLLAEKELQNITVDEIYAIAEEYGANLKQDFSEELINFYRRYLLSCLEDKFISDEELSDLKHLKYVLGLNDKVVEEIHQEIAGMIYKQEVEKVIRDGELDEKERLFIEKLQNDLKLPKEVADAIYQKSGQELIKSFMNDAIADAQLTPQEEKELYAIAKNLNAELKLDEATKSDLEKYKLYWQIENGELPQLVVNINIPRSEKCYFQHNLVHWNEETESSEQDRFNNSGLILKIAKGLYWREGAKETKSLEPGVWDQLDEGNMFLTNKRILFKGAKGDKIVLLSRVLDFTVYENGIELEKDGSKNVFLKMEHNTDIFAMLLGKAISQLKL